MRFIGHCSGSIPQKRTKMADIVGLDGLHNIEGYKCDLCGRDCDPKAHELNALDCTFASCPKSDSLYHQECLEKYLKSIKLEK